MVPHRRILIPALILLGAALGFRLFSVRAFAAPAVLSTPGPGLISLFPVSTSPDAALRLAYGETAPQGEETTLWLADVPNLAQKNRLAVIRHRVGYPPLGTVSPDGKMIAVLVIPPGTSEKTIRINGGDFWLIHSDGSESMLAATLVGSLGDWSPDSRWITYTRLVPLDPPSDPQVTFRTDLYRVSSDLQTTSLLLSDQQAYGIHPLGWSPDSSRYLVARLDTSGGWTVRAQDAASGKELTVWTLPSYPVIREIHLSPDASQVLVEHAGSGQDTVSLLSLSAAGQTAGEQALASGSLPDPQAVSPVMARWSVNGRRMWLYRAPRPGAASQSSLFIPGQPSIQSVPVNPQAAVETLLPADWSPDENWLVWRQYPNIYSTALLQNAQQNQLVSVSLSNRGNWITIFGWIAR